MKQWKIFTPLLVVVLLAGAFWYGGDAPGMQGWTVETVAPAPTPEAAQNPTTKQPATPVVTTDSDSVSDTELSSGPELEPELEPELIADPEPEPTPEQEPELNSHSSDAEPGENPLPIEPEDAVISDVVLTCTLSVHCDTILDHMDWLTDGKEGLIPEDGVIFPETQVSFYQGESVFNVLLREMKQNKIHMEYETTPMYNSAYIEGIHNIYEFDVGERSGWAYQVNGWFPNYGASRYELQDGDVIQWIYTCDMGEDIGGSNHLEG